MKKLLVIDGNSILNRAFYGVRPLSTKEGLPTNALYGMTNILWSKLDEYKPDYAAVAFDLPAPTFRHLEYDGYKANRHKMPEELAQQLPYAKELCAAMGMSVLTKEGFEADDILGTVAHMAAEQDVMAYILTGDRDSLQLIGDKVNILLATNKDTLVFDRNMFFEKYGVEPECFVDVKALMGDSSDNIPGVPGIGEKTALKLISEYNSLDGVYDKFEDSSLTEGVKRKLRDGKESAYLSKFLAKINTETPLEKQLCDFAYQGFDNEGFGELLAKLEFSAMLKRLDYSPKQRQIEFSCKETESLSSVITEGEWSVCFSEDEAFASNGEVGYRAKRDETDLCALFGGNAKLCVFDCKSVYHTLYNMGVEKDNIDFDVSLATYVVNSGEAAKNAESAALSYLGMTYEDKCGEAFALIGLKKELLSRMDQQMRKLYYEIEFPLARVLCDMERLGFCVDVCGLSLYGEKLSQRARELEGAIYDIAGEEFNLNSPKQLGVVLFEKLELPCQKKTKSGYSTSADVLEKLRPYHPVIDMILEYRQITKLNSTYVVGLCKLADEKGFVHTTFNQAVTATGRLSSTEPNLQNIPIKTEMGRELRRYFLPSSKDRVLVDADYSQIELRILAAISGDQTMIEAFAMGVDIHTLTASQVFRVFPEAVTPEMRKRAKAVNFGIVYGIGDFSLASDIGVTKRQAATYIQNYLDTYPGIQKYLEDIVEKAREDGYVTTLLGRRRYIPELSTSKKMLVKFGERVAMNSPIQGTAADIIKIAMINTAKRLEAELPDAKLILQVHDELIVDAKEDEKEDAARILREEMENAYKMAVPLTVEVNCGTNWYEAK